jgi:hypothetical protein
MAGVSDAGAPSNPATATASRAAFGVAVAAVALVLVGLLVGFQPTGADPDLLYRPIKAELARALQRGTLPFWSDRFGLGVPLVAESHAAAFYPPNWLLYRFIDVDTAYRLSMWAHHVALAAALYLYARSLALTPWGAALSVVAFTLCAFMSIHAGHEPFYHALPWMPLALLAADRYVATGRLLWMACIALAWGLQLTLGHFQLQAWTAGLVLFIGTWRQVVDRRPRRRVFGLVGSLVWGAGIAAVQLALTAELTMTAGFARTAAQRMLMAFPLSQWIQAVIPSLFVGLKGGATDAYWASQLTTGGEAAFWIGTIPLILAFVGWRRRAARPDPLAPWRAIAIASVILACIPRLAPPIYAVLLQLPVVGWFRAPARFTLLTSLALTLIAGRGFDRSIEARRFRLGVAFAVGFALLCLLVAVLLTSLLGFRESLRSETIGWRFFAAVVGWAVGLGGLFLWRVGRAGPWLPVAVTALELSAYFFLGSQPWTRSSISPGQSPVLRSLAGTSGVGLVAGRLEDLPVRVGLTVAYPYLGISPPPPTYLLEATRFPVSFANDTIARWMRRFGVTHGVWRADDEVADAESVLEVDDPILDHYLGDPAGAPARRWKLVRYPGSNPPAWVAKQISVTQWPGEPAWIELFGRLSAEDHPDLALYQRHDAPAESREPRATRARVAYDGNTAIVEHDGACDLILRRASYPGWSARIDQGPEIRVRKANGGLQAIPLGGRGTTRVELSYQPTWLVLAGIVSVAALLAALGAVLWDLLRRPVQFVG